MTFTPSETLRFRYADIFFSYYMDYYTSCAKKVHDHMLAYVYSGGMFIWMWGSKIFPTFRPRLKRSMDSPRPNNF